MSFLKNMNVRLVEQGFRPLDTLGTLNEAKTDDDPIKKEETSDNSPEDDIDTPHDIPEAPKNALDSHNKSDDYIPDEDEPDATDEDKEDPFDTDDTTEDDGTGDGTTDDDEDGTSEDDPDSSVDDDTTESDPDNPDAKQVQILELSPVDRELNNIRLHEKFVSLDSTIGIIYTKLYNRTTIESDDENESKYSKALSDIRKLRELYTEYLTHKYMIKSYEENLVYYSSVSSTLNDLVSILLEEADNEKDDKTKDK